MFSPSSPSRACAQSPPVQPAPNQRSLEEVIRELEAMKQPHGSIRAAVRPLPPPKDRRACRTGVPRIQAWVTGARSLRGTEGRRDCECALLRMQPAPNSHRSGSPKDAGPDDFGASPIVGTLPNGKTILVAGQRPGSFGRTIRTANAPFYGRRPWLPRRRPSEPGEFRWQRQRRECLFWS